MFMEITQQASVILLSSLTQAGCTFPLVLTPLRNRGDRPQKPPDAKSLNLSIKGTSGSSVQLLSCPMEHLHLGNLFIYFIYLFIS